MFKQLTQTRRFPHRRPHLPAIVCLCVFLTTSLIAWKYSFSDYTIVQQIPPTAELPREHHRLPPRLLDTIPQVMKWGQNLSSSYLTTGLTQFAPHRSDPNPIKGIDGIYRLGPESYTAYTARIDEFVSTVLPSKLQLEYQERQSQSENLRSPSRWNNFLAVKKIWQKDKNYDKIEGRNVQSWRNGLAQEEGWQWSLLTDDTASTWIRNTLGGTIIEYIWDNFPSGILGSDLLRCLLVAFEGGIYSDTDTYLHKPPSEWSQDADLWQEGKGWMEEGDIAQWKLLDGILSDTRYAEIEKFIGKPSIIVGIEAEVSEEQEWDDGWKHDIHGCFSPILSWSIASAPYHPIMLDCVLRIIHNTASAIDLAKFHYTNYLSTLERVRSGPLSVLGRKPSENDTLSEFMEHMEEGQRDVLERLAKINVLTDPQRDDPFGIVTWTGPSVLTDSVLSYLLVRYGVTWRDLNGRKRALRVGDVLILPGNGSGSQGHIPDEHTLVEHHFAGSWKQ